MNTEVHFSQIESRIIDQLNNSNYSIKIAVAWITSPTIIETITNCVKSGIDVQLITVNDKINNINLLSKLLYDGVEIRLQSGKLMHNKFCIIDNKTIISGSYNWTVNAKSNHENITINYNDIDLINKFNNEFIRIWNKSKNLKDIIPIDKNEIDKIEEEFQVYLNKIKNNNKIPYFYFLNERIKPDNISFYYSNKSVLFSESYRWEWSEVGIGYYLISNQSEENEFFEYLYYSKINDLFKNFIPYSKKWEITATKFYNIIFENNNLTGNFISLKNKMWVVRFISKSGYYLSQINNNGIVSELRYKILADYKYQSFVIEYEGVNKIFKNGKILSFNYNRNENPTLNSHFSTLFINSDFFISEVLIEKNVKRCAVFDIFGNAITDPFFYSTSIDDRKENQIIIYEYPVLFLSETSVISVINCDNYYNRISISFRQQWKFTNKVFTKIGETKTRHDSNGNEMITLYSNDSDYGPLYLAIAISMSQWERKYFEMAKSNYLKQPKTNDFYVNYDNARIITREIEIIKEKDLNRIINKNRQIENNRSKSSESCFIATAVYGNTNHPKTIDFRIFRDQFLKKMTIGRKFIYYYYKFSPFYVVVVKKSYILYFFTKVFLDFLHFLIKSLIRK